MTDFVLKCNNVAKKVLIYIVGKLDHKGCFMSIEMKKVNVILIMVLSLAFLITSIALAGGLRAVKKYQIPEHGVLELNVPNSWKGDIHKPQKDVPPAIIFSPKKGNDFQVLITVLWDKIGEQDFNSPDKIRTYVQEDGQKILPKAVETKLLVQQMRGVNNTGYFFSLTDKAPNPGEFRYITRGGMAVGNLLLNVTILYRVEDSESVKDALSVLREAKQSAK